MSEFEVRIVRLPPLRVASALGFGQEPELQGREKLDAWAKPRGFLDRPEQQRIFGFNHPDPSPGSPNYGYEYWMVVGAEAQPEGEVTIKDIPGGLYAVARCEVHGDPYEVIPTTWQKLVEWRETSPYRSANHQWLEEHVDTMNIQEGEFTLDLYLPIAE